MFCAMVACEEEFLPEFDDEYEEQKREVNELGTAMGGFSKMDMESYLDYN